MLWRITQTIQRSERIDDALHSALFEVATAAKAEVGTIWLLNKNDNRLYASYAIGSTQSQMQNVSIRLGEGIAGNVVQSGISEICIDCSKDERFAGKVDGQTGFVTKSMVCVPLRNKYECLGCIQLINKVDGELFSSDDVELCENLASLVAIALGEHGFALDYEEGRELLLKLENVGKTYGKGETSTEVLKGINLSIFKGEFLVILGESGCGKSTILNIVGGMDVMTSGKMSIMGKAVSNASDKELTEYRRSTIGFIFQDYNLMPNLTAAENIRIITDLIDGGLHSDEALSLVGLHEKKDHYPSQLSGGQQQRVSIARAVAKMPMLILADEPTAALDYQTSIEVLKVLGKIVKEKNCTIMMITHNPEIAKMADRVLRISSGRIAETIVNPHPLSASELRW